jgi:hypothetical protein
MPPRRDHKLEGLAVDRVRPKAVASAPRVGVAEVWAASALAGSAVAAAVRARR